MHANAVMIYQTCGLDKKSRIKMIRLFWCTSEDNVRTFCRELFKINSNEKPYISFP